MSNTKIPIPSGITITPSPDPSKSGVYYITHTWACPHAGCGETHQIEENDSGFPGRPLMDGVYQTLPCGGIQLVFPRARAAGQ